jgi:hypothetical protein
MLVLRTYVHTKLEQTATGVCIHREYVIEAQADLSRPAQSYSMCSSAHGVSLVAMIFHSHVQGQMHEHRWNAYTPYTTDCL